VIGATAPARADVEDRDPIPPPARAVTAGIMGHGGRYLGQSEGGFGPFLELAAGSGRWQGFAELGAMRIKAGEDGEPGRKGMFVRGGAGVRWLARSFMFDEKGSIDMHLEAFAGLGQLRWDRAEHVMRPDLGVGVGYDVRMFQPWKIAFRLSARAYFAPHDHSAAPATACHGTTVCSMDPASSSSSGLMALFGLSW
jgi:hypothetical protein